LLLDERDLLLDERLPPDDELLRLEPWDLARPEVDFFAVDARPDDDFFADELPPEDDFFAVDARPEDDFFADDALRFGEDPLLDFALPREAVLDDPPPEDLFEELVDLLDDPPDLLEDLSPDFCDGCSEDFACGDDPLEEPLPICPPTRRLTPPTTLVATPTPSRPAFFQSVRRRPIGRPSTVERRLSLRGVFIVASLRAVRRSRPRRFLRRAVLRLREGALQRDGLTGPFGQEALCGEVPRMRNR
jgi:hypothetical protein